MPDPGPISGTIRVILQRKHSGWSRISYRFWYRGRMVESFNLMHTVQVISNLVRKALPTRAVQDGGLKCPTNESAVSVCWRY